jgi:hypothetical protein
LGDAGQVRLQATEFLLLVGAAVVIMIERQLEHSALARAAAGATPAREGEMDPAPLKVPGPAEWGSVSPPPSQLAGA